MRVIGAKDILDLLSEAAKADSSGAATGWSNIEDHICCAFYPNTGPHGRFRYNIGGFVNKAEAIQYLETSFGLRAQP